ncbi:phosphatase PAP2 family protein [Heliomarina baculiformis]|uniref:phosphatase PAP2 family protein n=1 Tax=Heliomarina baculiformis TaxID=2872036 RepID=UPI001EE34109|nr:phosphatase PAP2 family protein [Heliomarina baculiformis]
MDEYLLLLSNSIIGHSDKIDYHILFLARNPLTKSLPLIVCFWALWFVMKEGQYINRSRVAASFIIALVSIIVGRFLAVVLPFRLRPIHTPDIDITVFEGLGRRTLDGWSSLPSDHAIFFASLCACVFMINRTLGIIISIYSFFIALLPRVIYGLHWPSDVFVGILIGAALAVLLMKPLQNAIERAGLVDTALRYETLFYPAMFLLTFQMATMFDSLRAVLEVAKNTVMFFARAI